MEHVLIQIIVPVHLDFLAVDVKEVKNIALNVDYLVANMILLYVYIFKKRLYN